MKLYGSGNTPNPRKVKIVLAEKDIPYEMVEMDLKSMDAAPQTHNPQ